MQTAKKQSMPEFKKYKRKAIVEMRPVTEEDIKSYRGNNCELIVSGRILI